MSTAIVVERLSKSYGSVRAVSDVAFEVQEGEVFAILGPNGAGKTTIVEILEGYRRRSSGTVSVLGMDPGARGRQLRSRIGIVLQECGFDQFLTVEEMLRQRRPWYPHPRSVEELLALVGLEDKRAALVKTLSGGQQRRLDLALGLVGDPDLLFLDEPTTGFDPSARRSSWDVVRTLCSLGKTVVLTTHYMDEAQALAHRVAVMVGGRIVAEGPPDSLGGRDRAAARISFSVPEALGAHLEGMPPGAVVRDGTVSIETQEPTRVLHAVTGWALERSIELSGLSVVRPTLEDVYIELAGGGTTGEGA
ncbi:MAG: ABC transporter ATP-binding protein [Acidimicrobiales bacterium]